MEIIHRVFRFILTRIEKAFMAKKKKIQVDNIYLREKKNLIYLNLKCMKLMFKIYKLKIVSIFMI